MYPEGNNVSVVTVLNELQSLDIIDSIPINPFTGNTFSVDDVSGEIIYTFLDSGGYELLGYGHLNDNLIYSTQDSLNRDYKRNKSSKKQINKKDCSDFQIGVDLLKEVEQYSQEQERDYQNYLDYVHNNMCKNDTSTLIMTKESYINSPKSAKKFWTDKFDEELEFKLEKGLSCFMSIQNTSVKSH